MANPHVKLGLRNASDSDVGLLATNVLKGMKQVRFPDLLVDLLAFEIAIDEFRQAIAIAQNGSRAHTADKNVKRQKVEKFIRQLAAYVESVHNGNLEILVASGFPAKNPSHAPGPIPKAVIRIIKNGITGELELVVHAIKNAKTYLVQCAVVSPGGELAPWQDYYRPFTNSRLMRVNDLTPGTTYMFRVCAVGT